MSGAPPWDSLKEKIEQNLADAKRDISSEDTDDAHSLTQADEDTILVEPASTIFFRGRAA